MFDLSALSEVTAVCGLFRQGGRILAVNNSRGWDIPGGYLEDDESPYQALVRELQEEAALQVSWAYPTVILSSDRDPSRITHMIIYEVTGILHHFIPNEESKERAWFDEDVFLQLYSGGNHKLMALILAKSRAPWSGEDV
jgi:8-oxo-dGTP pyrophosphatase MutT (NUDIX family)